MFWFHPWTKLLFHCSRAAPRAKVVVTTTAVLVVVENGSVHFGLHQSTIISGIVGGA